MHPHRLVLRPRVDPSGPPHGCQVGCEDNMCKGTSHLFRSPAPASSRRHIGQELTRYIETRNTRFDRIIYIGDGSNDFCAVLRLRRSVSPPSLDAHIHARPAKTSCSAVASAASNAKLQTNAPKAAPPASSAPLNIGPAHGKSRKSLSCTLRGRTSIEFHHAANVKERSHVEFRMFACRNEKFTPILFCQTHVSRSFFDELIYPNTHFGEGGDIYIVIAR